ncbi:MAG: hypothetical protein HY255_09775, partial [Betaproteobacteria bacterium]|nr:hypothetical protein [Betaproteobacteria bacterium]
MDGPLGDAGTRFTLRREILAAVVASMQQKRSASQIAVVGIDELQRLSPSLNPEIDRIRYAMLLLPVGASRDYFENIEGRLCLRRRLPIDDEIRTANQLDPLDRLAALVALTLEAKQLDDFPRARDCANQSIRAFEEVAELPMMHRAKIPVRKRLQKDCFELSESCLVFQLAYAAARPDQWRKIKENVSR